MNLCPECNYQLEFTSGVIMCTNCNYSECHCKLCSSQDVVVDAQTSIEQTYTDYIELKGDVNHVEQAD
jgi:hypothetical protein